jgi:ribosome-associated translation inhibitor RaiA
MQPNITLHFKDIAGTPALDARLRRMIGGLRHLNRRLVSCQVLVEAEHDESHRTPGYLVLITVNVPGAQIHADNRHAPAASRTNLLVGVRSVFHNVKRQLIDLRERRAAMRSRAA